ncbi:unnamed protein product, partial [Ectocarpus sp. 12 AP-2014]
HQSITPRNFAHPRHPQTMASVGCVSSPAATTVSPPSASTAGAARGATRGVRPFRRKQRGWIFHFDGITNHAVTEADLLLAVRERYTTVKRL